MKLRFNYRTGILLLLATASFLIACSDNKSVKKQDTPTSGEIRISVDETFKPLMEAELKVFQSIYPKTHITAEYKPEADCFKDLFSDSSRMIIVTRELNNEEKEYFKKVNIKPRSMLLAWDALALVTNNENPDSIFTMQQVREIMAGTSQRKWQLVFDNEKSSTVRFIVDSINKGKPLPPQTMSAKGNAEVIDYVSKNKDAIGVIGVNWISDTDDYEAIEFTNKVNVVKVRADYGSEFVQPYQLYIASRSYPLVRGMFFILKEPHQGLGSGFATFLGSQEGQLLIRRFKLFPARSNVVFRDATIK
ncbi:substrate-binding domain-containing protein [Chitinophaga horti]|uniref:Substrate-binding domain-containing protein n=1 Tax=Chitinophaga horti TaxID=2920382 RepID=A0ABY6J5C7_9BACT|nr:substrate-binding domain-containing protein [Chitinophaga horti]UYQ93437.1 substrate-binding domain-containing protein [Chitinophaga horti]